MIRLFHFMISIIFLCTSLSVLAQSGGKTVSELFLEVEITENVRLLEEQCWSLRESNSDSAIIIGQQALDLAIKHNLRKKLPKLYGYLGVVQLHYLYKTKEAIPFLHRSLEYSLQEKDSVQLAYSYNNLGDLYLLTGNLPLALEFAKNSLQLFEKLNHTAGISYACVNLGLVYREKKKYDLAFDYFETALVAWKELGQELGVGSVTLEIARTYQAIGNIDEAMLYYQKAYEKSIGSGNARYTAFCLHGIANIFILKKEYSKAYKYYQEALQLNHERNFDFGLVDDYIGIALINAHENKRAEAEFNLQKALSIANRLGLNTKILEVHNAFAELYQIIGDQDMAIETYKNFSIVYDSILSIHQFEIIDEMQNRFSMHQTLSETEQELESRKIQERYLVIILILMLVIALVLYWRYQSHRKINLKLAQINQTKDKLFSVISHDLRNPFNSLIGFSELLLKEVKEGKYENVETFTSYMNQSSKEGLKLLTNLLDWSRSQTGAITFKSSPLKLNWLFGELAGFFDLEQQRYQVKMEFTNLIEEEILADADILRTILINLISNAIKFTKEGGLIQLHAQSTNSFVKITVKDNGIGMSEDIVDSLFDNAKTTTSTIGLHKEQGTGLGLSICADLIRIHKGTIEVKSKLGKGTSFEIKFPFEKADSL